MDSVSITMNKNDKKKNSHDNTSIQQSPLKIVDHSNITDDEEDNDNNIASVVEEKEYAHSTAPHSNRKNEIYYRYRLYIQ
jgi:hypothetical protein